MYANKQSVKGILRQDAGAEPWDIVAVGLMTDASNTHEKASAVRRYQLPAGVVRVDCGGDDDQDHNPGPLAVDSTLLPRLA